METFSISGEHLGRLCQHFRIPLAGASSQSRDEMRQHDIPVFKKTRFEAGHKQISRWIESLCTHIVAPNQLEMLMRWGFEDETDQWCRKTVIALAATTQRNQPGRIVGYTKKRIADCGLKEKVTAAPVKEIKRR